MKILNLLLQTSYNIPKMLSSEFQTCSIKIEDFKINPINLFNPISTKEGSTNFKPITKNVLCQKSKFLNFRVIALKLRISKLTLLILLTLLAPRGGEVKMLSLLVQSINDIKPAKRNLIRLLPKYCLNCFYICIF